MCMRNSRTQLSGRLGFQRPDARLLVLDQYSHTEAARPNLAYDLVPAMQRMRTSKQIYEIARPQPRSRSPVEDGRHFQCATKRGEIGAELIHSSHSAADFLIPIENELRDNCTQCRTSKCTRQTRACIWCRTRYASSAPFWRQVRPSGSMARALVRWLRCSNAYEKNWQRCKRTLFQICAGRSPLRSSTMVLQTSAGRYAEPLPSNMLEWHFVFIGPDDTPFQGGQYHGKIKFPPEYGRFLPLPPFLVRAGFTDAGVAGIPISRQVS